MMDGKNVKKEGARFMVRRKRWKGWRLNKKGKSNLKMLASLAVAIAIIGYTLMGWWCLYFLIAR